MSKSSLLILLIIIRTLSELGSGSGSGPLFPLKEVSAGVASAIIIIAFINYEKHFNTSRIKLPGVGITAGALAFWALVGFSKFGFELDFLFELLRTLALIAIFVLSYQLGTESGSQLPRWLDWLVGIPAIALILGFVLGWEPTLSAGGRATGPFVHPNSAAAFFAVGTIGCMWGYMQSRRRSSFFVMSLAFVALLLTKSLGGIVGISVGALVLLALNVRLAASRRIILIAVSSASGFFLAQITGALGRLTEFQNFRYRGNIIGGTDSLNWRLVNWLQLVELWADDSPLFGFGWGSTRLEVLPLGSLPHSIYIQLLVETGIVGLLFVSAIFLSFIRSVFRRFKRYPQTAAALAAIGSTVLAHGLVANWLSYVPAQYLALFTLGVMLGYTRPLHTEAGRVVAHPSRTVNSHDLRGAGRRSRAGRARMLGKKSIL